MEHWWGWVPKAFATIRFCLIEGKQLVFSKSPYLQEGRLFLGGGYLGEVGWLTSHKSSDFWTLANAPRGLSVPQGTLSLQAARAWRFLCQNSAGGREESEVSARIFRNIWVMAWGWRQFANDVYINKMRKYWNKIRLKPLNKVHFIGFFTWICPSSKLWDAFAAKIFCSQIRNMNRFFGAVFPNILVEAPSCSTTHAAGGKIQSYFLKFA